MGQPYKKSGCLYSQTLQKFCERYGVSPKSGAGGRAPADDLPKLLTNFLQNCGGRRYSFVELKFSERCTKV
ncbi:hypothetical protein EVAR_49776_1 [Eumeta japonica]|uniref:Uncharacterized protein n=1 Tax=Eumeta variegata TaxID=151549 RepID=A0A4C1Y575_EUMVA|nr:hypothetical protein EVAR_49776_1 [Eumeta japonica]